MRLAPHKDFWSFTLYDNQARAMLQTDQQFPGIDNNKPGMIRNADDSYDVYFGPEAPDGQQNNWVWIVPGKGWNMLLRLYGPLEPWFEKAWRSGDPEVGVSNEVPDDHALVDEVSITGLGSGCPADLDFDDAVAFGDLVALLACWGPVGRGCERADIAGPDGEVNMDDLIQLLSAWGPCW